MCLNQCILKVLATCRWTPSATVMVNICRSTCGLLAHVYISQSGKSWVDGDISMQTCLSQIYFTCCKINCEYHLNPKTCFKRVIIPGIVICLKSRMRERSRNRERARCFSQHIEFLPLSICCSLTIIST